MQIRRKTKNLAMPWISWLIIGLSTLRPEFNQRLLHNGFAVHKAAEGQISFHFCGSTLSVTFHRRLTAIHQSITNANSNWQRHWKTHLREAWNALPLKLKFSYSIKASGAHSGTVGWGTALQVRSLWARFPTVSSRIFHWHNPYGRTVALGRLSL